MFLDVLNLLSMLYYLTRQVIVLPKTGFVAEESMTTSMKVGHCHELGNDHMIASCCLVRGSYSWCTG
jgi:hypothetical protein